MSEKEKLMFKLEEIEKRIKEYEEKLKRLLLKSKQEVNDDVLEEKINELKNKIYVLYDAKRQINTSLKICDSFLVVSNGIIDLYKKYDYVEGIYDICLHNTFTCIGYIYVQPLGMKRNNIAYEIYDEYRGNGYATQALFILTNYLCENGVENIEIFSRNDNKASIRVIEKFQELNPAFKIKNDGDETVYYFNMDNKLPKNAHNK